MTEPLTCFGGDLDKACTQFIRAWDAAGRSAALGSAVSYLLTDIAIALNELEEALTPFEADDYRARPTEDYMRLRELSVRLKAREDRE